MCVARRVDLVRVKRPRRQISSSRMKGLSRTVAYLIFVISITPAGFLNPKFYNLKATPQRVKYAVCHIQSGKFYINLFTEALPVVPATNIRCGTERKGHDARRVEDALCVWPDAPSALFSFVGCLARVPTSLNQSQHSCPTCRYAPNKFGWKIALVTPGK